MREVVLRKIEETSSKGKVSIGYRCSVKKHRFGFELPRDMSFRESDLEDLADTFVSNVLPVLPELSGYEIRVVSPRDTESYFDGSAHVLEDGVGKDVAEFHRYLINNLS